MQQFVPVSSNQKNTAVDIRLWDQHSKI